MKKVHFVLIIILISILIAGESQADNSVNNRLFKITSKSVYNQIDLLADSCWNIREKNPQEAISLGKIALKLASEATINYRVNELNNYIGAIYLNYLHDITNTVIYLEQALNLSLAENDSLQMGYAYNNLGDLYYQTNNLPLALKYDNQSYEIFQKIKNTRGVGYSLTNLGEAYLAKKDFNQALYYFQELNKLEHQLNNLSGISFSLLQIGETYLAKDNIDEALLYFNKAYELTEKFENRTFKAKCLTDLANIYLINKDFIKANEFINEAIKLNLESNYTPGLINNKLELALLLSLTDQQEVGEHYLEDASRLADQLQFPLYIIKVQKKKIEFYLNLNSTELLLAAYKQYFTVFDSLYTSQSFEALNEMQKSQHAQFAMERMSSDLSAKRNERVYMYIIISLLFVFGIILYLRFRTISLLNRKLKETNATKDKLFTIISHDLKSPFNSILGMCELMNYEFLHQNFEEAQKFGLLIQKTSNETYGLINNLLNWSKSQLSEIKLRPETFLLNKFTNQIIELYLPAAQLKNIQIKNSTLETNIYADRNCMNIVISNLLSNAIKFTRENGRIKISSFAKDDKIYLRISDNGVGIPEDKLSKLFDITENESTMGTKNEKGTGIGLVLCKQFIEANSGKLYVESVLDKGSTFTIEFPGNY